MKRLLAVALAVLTMTFMLAGCGSQGSQDITGNYQDSVSQRATMTINEGEDGTYDVCVMWSSSATEETEWNMNCKLEEGKLSYEDSDKIFRVYEDDDPESFEETELLGEGAGYFEITDGKLCWTGAVDKECKDCQFELVK